MDEDDRKKKVCNSKDDDDDDDVGGDSEMLLNKGVGQANLDINVFQEIKTTHLGCFFLT